MTDQTSQDWGALDTFEVPVVDLDTLPLYDVFAAYANGEGYPIIPTVQWQEINQRYRQRDIKKAIAKFIFERKVPFPLKPPTKVKGRGQFLELLHLPWAKFIAKPNDFNSYQPRVPYQHWDTKHILATSRSHPLYNASSNCFQWHNRIQCGGWRDASPLSAWTTEDKLNKLRWTFWSKMGKQGPNSVKAWKQGFLLSTDGIYQAAQFRPNVAKAFYGWLGAERILDPSCGWGDRLAGFYATPTAYVYAGCDPNADTFKVYAEQCVAYEGWLNAGTPVVEHFTLGKWPAFRSKGSKDVLIVNGPFEDVDWNEVSKLMAPDGFDFAFTSPPYFGVERYAEGTCSAVNQSWSKYPQFDGWLTQFLLPMVLRCADLVRLGGYVGINIVDPLVKGQRNEVCDRMVDALTARGMPYTGLVAMAMAKRPSSNKVMAEIDSKGYAEPVWMFKKAGDATMPSLEHTDLPAQGAAKHEDV